MREIKFRVWQGNRMHDHQEAARQIYNKSTGSTITAYGELMQYTGIKDKNGIEIYDGDILQLDFLNNKLERVTPKVKVVWGKWCYELFHTGIEKFHSSLDPIFLNSRNPEVIGNIYEHKHLLK